jgi:broad specificity polyphosphatase/5'/3'-nucleotidase SurE
VPQSTEQFHEYYLEQQDEQGQNVYKLAGGQHREESTPTDTTSLAEGFITITALAPGMTDRRRTAQLQEIHW